MLRYFKKNLLIIINDLLSMKTRVLLFLGLLCFCNQVTNAQVRSAGGVPGVMMWMQTDIVSDTVFPLLYKWNDISGDSAVLRLYEYGTEYKVGYESVQFYNFNPSPNLSVWGNVELLLNKTSLSQMTLFVVWAPNDEFDQDHFLYNINGRANEGVIMTQKSVIHSQQSGKPVLNYGIEKGKNLMFDSVVSSEPNINAFRERALRIQTYYRALQPNYSIWGGHKSVITLGGTYSPNNVNNNSSFDISQLRNMLYYGFTPELIIYNRILTPMERMKVESYLAIKYGLSLDTTYYNSGGSVIWDYAYAKEKGYNNRITGYGRDDSSGLYQSQSTTSYEEAPYYSDTCNSYFNNDPDYKLTPYRLLIAGKQNASPIADLQYTIIGDNGDSLSVSSLLVKNKSMEVMKRKWLLKVNNPSASDTDTDLLWNVQGLNMYQNKFTYNIIELSTAESDGSAVTTIPLKEREGYFSWETSSPLGSVTVKFGTDSPNLIAGSNDYGYYFDNNGIVYAIKQGEPYSDTLTIITPGQKIEIEKKGNYIYLRINERKVPYHRIIIDEQDVQSQFYGSVKIEKDTADIVMRNFQHGGFINTGDKLELSYKIADTLLYYRNIGKTYLLIDTVSTDGIFNPDNAVIIPSTDLDVLRSKIIFNNIFWNKYINGEGNAIFTFGYKTSELYGDTTHINPTCDNEEMPLQNGSIIFVVVDSVGTPGFNYSLQLLPFNMPQTGTFYDSIKIDNLASGTYLLTVSEKGGRNFFNISSTPNNTAKILSPRRVDNDNVWVDWNIRGMNTKVTVGFLAITPQYGLDPYAYSNPNYGVKIENNQIKKIIDNVVGNDVIFTITDSIGSRIRLERNGNTISITIYNHFDEIVYSPPPINIIDNSSDYHIFVSINQGSDNVYNLKTNGFEDSTDLDLDWDDTFAPNKMRTEYSTTDQVRYKFVLKSPCDGKSGITPPTQPNENIYVYNNDPNDLKQVMVSINLDNPSPGQVYLYDILGRLIDTKPLNSTLQKQEIQITLPVLGIYIIKVNITNENKPYFFKVI